VGSRAGLDPVAKRKMYHHYPYRELNPGRPTHSLVSILTELHQLLEYCQFVIYQELGHLAYNSDSELSRKLLII